MSWVEYVKKTKWADIKADVAEYRRLCRTVSELDVAACRAYGDLIKIRGPYANPERACVTCTVAWDSFDNEYNNDERFCENYNINKPCAVKDCPQRRANNRLCSYFRAYNDAKMAKNAFWVNKIAARTK